MTYHNIENFNSQSKRHSHCQDHEINRSSVGGKCNKVANKQLNEPPTVSESPSQWLFYSSWSQPCSSTVNISKQLNAIPKYS